MMSDGQSSSKAAQLLSEPVQFPCGRVAPNRLTKVSQKSSSTYKSQYSLTYKKAPMEEMLAKLGGGLPTDSILTLYGHWARGGWGMLITGEARVEKVMRQEQS